jgi:alpha-L-fucosidase 2
VKLNRTRPFLALLTAGFQQTLTAQNPQQLTYDKPAVEWTEALPIGNGRIGAMVFGGVEQERIQINEGSLWGGAPHNYTNPEAYQSLDPVRRLVFASKVEEAERVARSMMGGPPLLMPYQPFCDMRLHFPGHTAADAYRCKLVLDDAESDLSYKSGGVTFRRQAFVSYPDQVLVMRLTADQPG